MPVIDHSEATGSRAGWMPTCSPTEGGNIVDTYTGEKDDSLRGHAIYPRRRVIVAFNFKIENAPAPGKDRQPRVNAAIASNVSMVARSPPHPGSSMGWTRFSLPKTRCRTAAGLRSKTYIAI